MNSLIKYTLVILFCLAGSLLWLDSASGAKPTKVIVTLADPDSALQGQDLEVAVLGSGFDQGSTVRFLVAGTKDDTPVGVTGEILFIKENGKPEKLIVPIHVLNAALVDFYDVEVHTSSGRRGKGTDQLFRVDFNEGSENRSEKGTNECNNGIDDDDDGKIDGEDEDCFGAFKPDQDNSGRGKDLPLIAILDPHSWGNDLQHDDPGNDIGQPYVHGQMHVKALAGDPLPPRIMVITGGGGKNIREVHVNLQCDEIPESSEDAGDAIDNCDELGEDGVFDFTGGYIFQTTPYEVNCPNAPQGPGNPCLDVFSMGTGIGNRQFMSFKMYSGISPTIEAASDIGGATVVDPGNCLAQMSNAQRNAFITTKCLDPAECNVTVIAEDLVGGDGENDGWMIDGVNINALICRDGVVLGQTILNIGYYTFKK